MIANLLNHSLLRAVCCYLCLFLLCGYLAPSPATASFISSLSEEEARTSDSLQADLERKLVAEQLSRMGLPFEKISVRVDSLSDEELQEIAGTLGQVQSGGTSMAEILDEMPVALRIIVICILLYPMFLLFGLSGGSL